MQAWRVLFFALVVLAASVAAQDIGKSVANGVSQAYNGATSVAGGAAKTVKVGVSSGAEGLSRGLKSGASGLSSVAGPKQTSSGAGVTVKAKDPNQSYNGAIGTLQTPAESVMRSASSVASQKYGNDPKGASSYQSSVSQSLASSAHPDNAAVRAWSTSAFLPVAATLVAFAAGAGALIL